MEGEPESFVELESGRRLMVLRHVRDACHLLTAEGRCSSYSARPAACAAYPFALGEALHVSQLGGRSSVTATPLHGSSEPLPEVPTRRRLFVLSDAPCGANTPTLMPDVQDPIVVAAVVSVETELNDYVRLVETWNRRQRRRRFAGHRARTAEDYLGYLERGGNWESRVGQP